MRDEIKISNVSDQRHFTAPKICHNLNCGFQTHEPLAKCPECRRPLWTASEFRVISSLIVCCGAFLLIVGVGLGYIAYRNLAPGGRLPEGYETGVVMLSLIALFVSIFGMVIISVGMWQVLFGVANRRLIIVLLIFLFGLGVIIVLGRIILLLLS
ncbi:MAG: hypothetical protein WBD22_06385 [Pyrinomonadaceae bacterium]